MSSLSTTSQGHNLEKSLTSSGSVHDIVDFVLNRNKEQSVLYCNGSLAREKYRANHPTQIAVLKCMDGRLNYAKITKTMLGILHIWRNIGGKFDLGWPYFGELFEEWVFTSVKKKGNNCLVLSTYHCSQGSNDRGCAGWEYHTDLAINDARARIEQVARIYGKQYDTVHPLVVGIETDEDSLVFNGENGEEFSVADHTDMGDNELNHVFARMYPQMLDVVRKDLLQHVVGNQKHIKELREQGRTVADLDHQEQIIVVGRGVDWLHDQKALIIGPYSLDWPSDVAVAGKIIMNNFETKRLAPDAGVLLLTSALSTEKFGRPGWKRAIEKTRYMRDQSVKALQDKYPELFTTHKMQVLMGVMDPDTRLLHIVS
jgi:hypothetical protein